jgi:hypothetical protein
MKIIRFAFIAVIAFMQQRTAAQFTVSGVVLDSATREPLPGASVYCHNTTIGTATSKQGEFSLELKPGGFDLIFSYTGYTTQELRISTETHNLEILLVKEDKSLGEVVIRSSNEVPDGWEKYGDFFTSNFIGSTPAAAQTELTNHEVLKFYYYKRTNKLKVLATEPLVVNNKALGYHLRYQLDSFVYYYNTKLNTYRGYCLFSEMEGSDSMKKVWASNRAKVYNGSKLQFMRSYFDSTLKEDGFTVDILDENDETKFVKLPDPYDTTYYQAPDSTMEAMLWFPRKIRVIYNKRPESEYLKQAGLPKNVGTQISYIDLKDAIYIKENGYYYDQKDWVNQGYWTWKNLADQLPFDYEPD